MPNRRNFLKLATAVGASSTILATSACQSGSLSGSNNNTNASGGEVTTIKFLHTNDATNTALAKALSEAFNASQTKYKVTLESRPGGTEGDNLVKTRLSTGEMTDVFIYNSGSLMNNLNPSKNLIPLGDEAYVKDFTKPFTLAVTSTATRRSTAPRSARQRRRHHVQPEGLRRPRPQGPQHVGRVHGQQRQDQGRRQDGRPPDLRHHVDVPAVRARGLRQHQRLGRELGADYIGEQEEVLEPARLAGFQHTEDVFKGGYINSDAASLTLDNGLKARARRRGALPDPFGRHHDGPAEQP